MPLGINIPSFPDVPMVPGVPAVLRDPLAAAGSLVNSAENAALGAAQGIVGGVQQAIGSGLSAVNGAISNIQNLTGGSFGDVGSLVTAGFGDAPTALTGDDPSVSQSTVSSNTWGIFDSSGKKIAQWDSIKGFEYKQDWRLPNYPMEQGAFQSYNKVQTPFQARVTMTKGGKPDGVKQFLNDISTAANSTNLYTVDAGGVAYKNVSIEGEDYQRNAGHGVSMITVEISLLEIRTAPASTFSKTAQPNGADPVNGGTTQAVPLTTGPNMTNGQPTTSLQFATGTAAPQQLSDAASGVDPNTVQAVTNTQTPAVQDTAPNTPQPPAIDSANATPDASATKPKLPQAAIDNNGFVPADGPFSDGHGNIVTAAQLAAMNPPGTGVTQDPGTGTVYATTFNSDGTRNSAVYSAELSKKYRGY